MPSATTLILEPLPESAGFASSITGTVQMGLGATLSWLTASLYSGSVQDLAIVLGVVSLIVGLLYVLKRFIVLSMTQNA